MPAAAPAIGFQASLWAGPEPAGSTDGAGSGTPDLPPPARTELRADAWVDHWDSWLPGADDRFFELRDIVDWRVERRQMYNREVAVPRLVRSYRGPETYPLPWLVSVREALNRHYRGRAGINDRQALVSAGMCLYRDGRDSVAWHGDRLGRGRSEDTLIAILSLGAPRTLRLRPESGGAGPAFQLGHGDLLVMGGSCQRTYQHCVPKTAQPVGPRISIQFRASGVG